MCIKTIRQLFLLTLATLPLLTIANTRDLNKTTYIKISGITTVTSLKNIVILLDGHVLGDKYNSIFGYDTVTSNVVHGEFKIRKKVADHPGYISIMAFYENGKFIVLIKDYIYFPNDNINIVFDEDNVKFTGIGATKYNFLYRIKNAKIPNLYPTREWVKTDTITWLNFDKKQESLFTLYVKKNVLDLNKIKNDLTPVERQLLQLELISYYKDISFAIFRNPTSRFYQFKSSFADYKKFSNDENRRQKFLDNLERWSIESKLWSNEYLTYLTQKCIFDSQINGEIVFEYADKINDNYESGFRALIKGILNSNVDHAIKEKLLLRVGIKYIKNLSPYNYSQSITFLNQTINNKEYKDILDKIQNQVIPVTKGADIAPYSFVNNKGEIVGLEQFKGKVILLDLWFTGCGACITTVAAMPEVESKFVNKDVVFISVSIDLDKPTWLKSIDPNSKKDEQFTHASDYYSGPNTLYWNINTKANYLGSAFSSSFIRTYVPEDGFPTLLLIGKDGKFYMKDPLRPDHGGANKLADVINKALLEK